MQDRLGELFKGGDTTTTTENGDIHLDVMGERKDGGEVDSSLENFEQIKRITDRIHENSRHVKDLKIKSNKECAGEAQKAIFADLDSTMEKTAGLAKKAKAIIEVCEKDNAAYAKDHPKAPSLMFRKNMLDTSKRQMKKAFEDFQASSEEFKKALEEKITRQAKIVNPDITDDAIEELIQSKDPQAFMKDQMMGPSAHVIDRVAEIEERHEGILRIEQGVKEIQELFNDLAFLVDIQGEKLQNIEDNVMQTSEYTAAAGVELKKAEVSAKKARKKQCYILICCLIILVVILAPTLVSVLPNS